MEQCINGRNKEAVFHYGKKYGIVMSFNNENATKVTNLEKDFDIPRTTFTTTLKKKDKIISDFFLSDYTRKHDTVSGHSYHKHTFNCCQALALN